MNKDKPKIDMDNAFIPSERWPNLRSCVIEGQSGRFPTERVLQNSFFDSNVSDVAIMSSQELLAAIVLIPSIGIFKGRKIVAIIQEQFNKLDK